MELMGSKQQDGQEYSEEILPSICSFYAIPHLSPDQSEKGIEVAKTLKDQILEYVRKNPQEDLSKLLHHIQIGSELVSDYQIKADISIAGYEAGQMEACRGIFEFISRAVESKMEGTLLEHVKKSAIWLHVLLYVSSSAKGWIMKRKPCEIYQARPYDAILTDISGHPSFVRVVGPGEATVLPRLPNIRYFPPPCLLLLLITLLSGTSMM